MKNIFYILLFCLYNFQLSAQNEVSVSISAKINGTSYGIDFVLVSMETDQLYYSKILSPFKLRHSIIENLPPGKYRVYIFGSSLTVETPDDPIHKYFGFLEFEAGKSYYLGNFISREKWLPIDAIIYTIECDEIPKRVIRTLKRRKLIERAEDIIKTYPYHSDTLIFRVKNQR